MASNLVHSGQCLTACCQVPAAGVSAEEGGPAQPRHLHLHLWQDPHQLLQPQDRQVSRPGLDLSGRLHSVGLGIKRSLLVYCLVSVVFKLFSTFTQPPLL